MRSLHTLNAASHVKTVWQFISKPHCIWVRLLTQKYLARVEFRFATIRKSDSPFWKALIQHRHSIMDNLHRVVGDSSNVSILNDKWVPGVDPLLPAPTNGIGTCSQVADLISHTNQQPQWKTQLITGHLTLPLGSFPSHWEEKTSHAGQISQRERAPLKPSINA